MVVVWLVDGGGGLYEKLFQIFRSFFVVVNNFLLSTTSKVCVKKFMQKIVSFLFLYILDFMLSVFCLFL